MCHHRAPSVCLLTPPDSLKPVDSAFCPGVATPPHGQGLWPGLSLASLLEPFCLPCKRLSLVPGVKTETTAKSQELSKITSGEFGLGKLMKKFPSSWSVGNLLAAQNFRRRNRGDIWNHPAVFTALIEV